MRNYQKELKLLMSDFNMFTEGMARGYEVDFLGSESGWDLYSKHTNLEHARYAISHWPEWDRTRNLFNTRTESLLKQLTETIIDTADPAVFNKLQSVAQLDIPARYSKFKSLYPASKRYEEIWNQILKPEGKPQEIFSQKYREEVDQILGMCDDYIEQYNLGPTFFRESVMSVTVYVADMRMKEQVQRLTYDFWTMLSDIGGTISFYIGGTIITFFEIVFWCSDIHKKRKLKAFKRKKMQQVYIRPRLSPVSASVPHLFFQFTSRLAHNTALSAFAGLAGKNRKGFPV